MVLKELAVNIDLTEELPEEINIPITKKFGEFHRISIAGRGASSTVYKVKDSKSSKVYAMKEITRTSDKSKRIVDEVKMLSKFDCPNIITCYGIVENNNIHNIVLEYMDYGTLYDLLKKKKKIPEDALRYIIKNVCHGLHYIHDKEQLIHRDLKPSNILINCNGAVKLSDFGESGSLRSKSSCLSWAGTLIYMCPERISGEEYDFSSDIWSLGVMMYECASGKHPYISSSRNFWDLLDEIVEQPSPRLNSDDHSKDLRLVVNACLHKKPDNRPLAKDCLRSPFIESLKGFDMVNYLKN